MSTDLSNEYMTINEAKEKFNISRQAIVLAINNKRLNAKKIKGVWIFSDQDWNSYVESKYNRIYSRRNGIKMFDILEGPYSPSMIASIWGIDKQRVYHYIRKGDIPFTRLGKSYVIYKQDVLNNLHILLTI